VTNQKQPESRAQAKEHKSIFIIRMQRVVDQTAKLIAEGSLCLFEGYSVLLVVQGILLFVPDKAQVGRMYIICTSSPGVNAEQVAIVSTQKIADGGK
jgi:hypothetical protein